MLFFLRNTVPADELSIDVGEFDDGLLLEVGVVGLPLEVRVDVGEFDNGLLLEVGVFFSLKRISELCLTKAP